MTTRDILLLHGTWGHGSEWDELGAELTALGYTVHAPSYPHHGQPSEIDIWGEAEEVAKLGLSDYVDALVPLVAEMETPPIIVGHSLGGLVAQLVAAEVDAAGAVLLATAPTRGMFAAYPSAALLWMGYLPQWLRGRPMFPVAKKTWDRYVCNTTPQELSDQFYANLCAESGTVYREMVLWFLDPEKSSKVDPADIPGPVLVVSGGEDRCTVPATGRATAKRYGDRGTYVEIPGSDHMFIVGEHMPTTLTTIHDWAVANGIAPT